jgi:hypothetical protein
VSTAAWIESAAEASLRRTIHAGTASGPKLGEPERGLKSERQKRRSENKTAPSGSPFESRVAAGDALLIRL